MQRVLAIGGGGFLMEDGPSPIDAFILSLVAKPKPRICLISTPSGDHPEHIEKFYAAFNAKNCEPSHLAFFRQPMPGSIPLANLHERVLGQDIIFVGGGNTKSALGVWREWGLDQTLKSAYENGVLLTGMSAGAMCWFEAGLTDSFWGAGYRPLACLGLLKGGCGVHYRSDSARQERLRAAIEVGAIPASVAIDDYAAVLYEDGAVSRVLSWRAGATAFAVAMVNSTAEEKPYAAITL
jgi:dipeptidase E